MTGAGDRSRTCDILITSEALYQLSYTGIVRAATRTGTDRTGDLTLL